MGIEHRWSRRQPVSVEVLLDAPRRGLIRGHIRNISAGGLFVQVRSSALRIHTVVNVVLIKGRGETRHVERQPAIVVRTSRDGAGLMVEELIPPMHSLLRATEGGGKTDEARALERAS